MWLHGSTYDLGIAGPWRVPTDGCADRVSIGIAPLMALNLPTGTNSRHRPGRIRSTLTGRSQVSSLEVHRPFSALPWRVHFPEPDPEAVRAIDVLPCSGQPPEGDTPCVRTTPVDRVPVPARQPTSRLP